MKKLFDSILSTYTCDSQSLLERIERLEEENIETTNLLYELMHSIDAVDARIDILMEKNEHNK